MKQKHEEINEIIYEVSEDFRQNIINELEEKEIDIEDIINIEEYFENWYNEDYYHVIEGALRNYCKIATAQLFEREGIIRHYVRYYLLDDEKERDVFESSSY